MVIEVFTVSPPGIYGMDALAKFLNALTNNGVIGSWSPVRAESGSRNSRYMVRFSGQDDALCALSRWVASDAAMLRGA